VDGPWRPDPVGVRQLAAARRMLDMFTRR
jgi:hypothetical protein